MKILVSVTFVCAGLGSGTALASQEAVPSSQADSVCATFLANAGFLLAGSGEAVLIDAFVTEPYSMYGALTPQHAEALAQAHAPFDNVVFALASHVHRDHFQTAPASAFLNAGRAAQLMSTPQVIESLGYTSWTEDSDRALVVWPETGRDRVVQGAVQIEFLPMRHTNARNYGVQNLAHLVRIGDASFLHVGDAEMLPEHYDRFDLVSEEIEVGLIPYWFFMSESGRRIVYEHIAAKTYVAMHIPPAETRETIDNLAEIDPAIIVAVRPGQSWCF